MRVSKRDLTAVYWGILFLVSFWGSSCKTTPSPDLDTLTKAKLTTQLRQQAKDCLQQFIKSGGLDFEKLECYADKQQQTTIMHPSPVSCPGCYFGYAKGLGLLGRYYYTTRQVAEKKIESAAPGDEAELEATIQSATDKMLDFFRQSCDVYELYFSAGQGVDLEAFDNASQQYMELGDYSRAKRCLERLLRSKKLNANSEEEVKRRLNHCKKELRKQQRDKVRKELGLDSEQE